ncbi:MAG: hypothetical protein ACE5EP_03230, partial [Candidatus Methylomirabilales bacterium]
AVLLPLGAILLSTSITENTISSNQASATKAFQLAEAGAEHARLALIPLSPSNVLDGTTGVFGGGKGKGGPINTANLAGGSYTIATTNNIAANGFPRGTIAADAAIPGCIPSLTQDCDRIVVVSSTGSFQASQRMVEAIIRVPAPAEGAVYMMNGLDLPPGDPVEIEDLDVLASISGNDCNPPSAGGGPGPGPDVHGIAVQTPSALGAINADIGIANPQVTGINPAGDTAIVPDAMSDEDFTTWVNTLITTATDVGTGACGGGTPPGLPVTLGTWANPQICFVATLADDLSVFIPDGSTGAGILIVNDFDPNAALFASTLTDFTYEGIVIVAGDGRLRLEGNSKVYGTVIQKNIQQAHSQETRLRLSDNSDICYSSLAVQRLQETLKPAKLAWYERGQ